MFKLRTFIIVIAISIFTTSVNGQVSFKGISLEAGIIHNLTPVVYDENNVTFYPEVNFRGSLYNPNIEWIISLGYWDDGIKEEFININTYTNSSTVFGFQVRFHPQLFWERSQSPFRFNLGVSWHYTKSDYIGGGYNEPDIQNIKFKQSLFNIDLGFDLAFEISRQIEIYPQSILLIPLTKHKIFEDSFRYQFMLGIYYKI